MAPVVLLLLALGPLAQASHWPNQRCAALLKDALMGEPVAARISKVQKMALLGDQWASATHGIEALRELLTIRERSWRSFFLQKTMKPDERALLLAAQVLGVSEVSTGAVAPDANVKYPSPLAELLLEKVYNAELAPEARQPALAYILAEGALSSQGSTLVRQAARRLMETSGLVKGWRFSDKAVLLLIAHGEEAQTTSALRSRLEDFGIATNDHWRGLLLEVALRRSIRGESEGYRGGETVRGHDLYLQGLMEYVFADGDNLRGVLMHAEENFDGERAFKLARYVLANASRWAGGPAELAAIVRRGHMTSYYTDRTADGPYMVKTAVPYSLPTGLLRQLWPLLPRLDRSAFAAAQALVGHLFTQREIVEALHLRDERGVAAVYRFSEDFVEQYPAEEQRFMAGAPYPFRRAATPAPEAPVPVVEDAPSVVEEPQFQFHGETVTVSQIEASPALRHRVVNECFPFLPDPDNLDDALRSLSPTMGDDILHQVASHISHALSSPLSSGSMPSRELWPLCGAMVDRYEESLALRMPGFDDFTLQFRNLRRAFAAR